MRPLGSLETRVLLEGHGVPFAKWRVVESSDAALEAAHNIGWPVVLRSAASDVVHKSDSGCVALGLGDPEALAEAYTNVMANAGRAGSSAPHLVLVEKMSGGLAELAIGVKRDATFGPVMMIGLGGIWVEVMRDYVLRPCPITPRQARDCFEELKGFSMLSGGRGQAPCDLDAVADLAGSVSRFAVEQPDLVELDLNPVIAFETGALAIDARIIFSGE